jgi:hypothetical protein
LWTVCTNNQVTDDLRGIARGVFARVQQQLDHAYKNGWRLPPCWEDRLRQSECPVGEDFGEWSAALFQQFCSEISFPPEWSILHKLELFSDLLERGR